MHGKLVKESAVEDQVYSIFPNDLNPQGTIFGGRVLELIDKVGAIVAKRHSGKTCVTASIDSVDFIRPARAGDLLILKASVNNAWNTSCEVGVKVFVEDHRTREIHHLASAYLTYVALDKNKKPASMPRIIPKTPKEKRRFRGAEIRREVRLKRKQTRREKNERI